VRHHCHRVVGAENVTVAQYRDRRHGRLELSDRIPIRLARIALRRGARMQGDRRHAALFGDSAGVPEGEVVVVDAFAEF